MNAQPVSARRTRGLIAGLIVAGGLVLTSACAAGQQAQTADAKPTLDGTQAQIGNIKLRGIAIVPPAGNSYPAGANARMRLVIANAGNRADNLTGVSSPAFAGWSSFNNALAATANIGGRQTVSVAPGSRASFGVPDTRSVLVLRASKKRIFPGTTVRITFTFARAGAVSVVVPIQISSPPGSSVVPGPSATGQAP